MLATTSNGSKNRLRFHLAGIKVLRSAVCRASMEKRYLAFVAIVAVAVIAENATVGPDHGTGDDDRDERDEPCCVDGHLALRELAEEQQNVIS